ncbi:MAG: VOC family protein [Moritella sp.]|uniref:glyoxalase superfamily protein n=1 Tax=Moritella sp. TaxID=78556 RepID=UPI001D55C257|nr:glyoxalase superfamily protein [Moritella sp.]NQZ51522.1 VOC family protein [Moritella sp.]
MKFGNTTPILRSFDEIKAKEFYLEFLEFNLDWEHRFEDDLPLYMQVSKDGCVLHITEHHGDCSPGAALRIQVTNLEQYHELLRGKKYKHARPEIQAMPWGSKDMSIADPFGNRLIFTSAVST